MWQKKWKNTFLFIATGSANAPDYFSGQQVRYKK
jgi:hypothetical protein